MLRLRLQFSGCSSGLVFETVCETEVVCVGLGADRECPYHYIAFGDSFLRGTTRTPTSPSEACFAVHDFVGGLIFMSSCYFAMSRQVSSVATVLHSGSGVPTCDFLVVHQLCFAQAEVQPLCRFFTSIQWPQIFHTRFLRMRQRWWLPSFFPWFWHDTNNHENSQNIQKSYSPETLNNATGVPMRYRQHRSSKKYRDIVENAVSRL